MGYVFKHIFGRIIWSQELNWSALAQIMVVNFSEEKFNETALSTFWWNCENIRYVKTAFDHVQYNWVPAQPDWWNRTRYVHIYFDCWMIFVRCRANLRLLWLSSYALRAGITIADGFRELDNIVTHFRETLILDERDMSQFVMLRLKVRREDFARYHCRFGSQCNVQSVQTITTINFDWPLFEGCVAWPTDWTFFSSSVCGCE